MGRRFRNDPAMLGTTLWYDPAMLGTTLWYDPAMLGTTLWYAICKCFIDCYGGK